MADTPSHRFAVQEAALRLAVELHRGQTIPLSATIEAAGHFYTFLTTHGQPTGPVPGRNLDHEALVGKRPGPQRDQLP